MHHEHHAQPPRPRSGPQHLMASAAPGTNLARTLRHQGQRPPRSQGPPQPPLPVRTPPRDLQLEALLSNETEHVDYSRTGRSVTPAPSLASLTPESMQLDESSRTALHSNMHLDEPHLVPEDLPTPGASNRKSVHCTREAGQNLQSGMLCTPHDAQEAQGAYDM